MASVFKPSRKRKRSMRDRAEQMRQAKLTSPDPVAASNSGETSDSRHRETSRSSVDLDLSLQLPGPSLEQEESNSSSPSSTETDTSEDEDVTAESFSQPSHIQGIYDDWIFSLDRDDRKTLAMMLYDIYTGRFDMQKTAAAVEIGQVLGVSDKTIRLWRRDFISNGGEFSEYGRGRYQRYVIIDDEEYKEMALAWVRSHTSVKGRPNMTASNFCAWVNSTLISQVRLHHPQVPASITDRTAVRWLHQLGFHPSSTKKGVYIDGHERSDVVTYRKLYLRKLEILESAHAPPPPVSDEPEPEPSDKRKLVLVFHDEAAYHSNDDQRWMWSEEGKQPIRPKSQGRGLMVSDFIDEHNGYLRLTDEEYKSAKSDHPGLWKEARQTLKIGAEYEGYWDNEKFMKQVDKAITIAEIKYNKQSHSLVFLFDQSSGHTAYSDDSLNVCRMNVKPGGVQPVMHDTLWNGKYQRMVFPNGVPKGMRQVLEERGINTTKMKAENMREVLGEMSDFKYEKTKVEKLVSSRGHRALFIPKFHCELNPIESCWCFSKRYTRSHCDYSFPGLEATINPSLDNVPLDAIRKFYRKTREIMKAYREGLTPGPEMTKALKKYKSHRRISTA